MAIFVMMLELYSVNISQQMDGAGYDRSHTQSSA